MQIPGLYIAHSEGKGRGVFTAHALSEGDLIEICPLVIVPPDQVKMIHDTILHDYYFLYPEPEGSACIALGYGSLYNHQVSRNAKVSYDLANHELHIICIKEIEAGNEIFIDYEDGEKSKDGLWF